MHSRQAFLSAISVILVLSSTAQSKSENRNSQFTIQVAAFTDINEAIALVGKLSREGESPVWGEVDVPGRGRWVRIFIGVFNTFIEARRYAQRLVARSLIREFLVKPSGEMKLLMRPRSIALQGETERDNHDQLSSFDEASDEEGIIVSVTLNSYSTNVASPLTSTVSLSEALPIAGPLRFDEIPGISTSLIPRSDPVRQAFHIIAGNLSVKRRGGLWLSGDLAEGLARLRWIVGPEHAHLLRVDGEGRLSLDGTILASLAGIEQMSAVTAPPVVASYISLNEGLLLLVQMIEGSARYCLHLGSEAPTRAGKTRVSGSINLDNNYDSRINPYRTGRAKLDQERPPAPFDAMVALNPSARWFNLRTDRFVPVAQITFHELAEAYAKVAMELEYLPRNGRVGAHDQALDREERLREQRPADDLVTTFGPNRVLRTEEELRQFYTSGSQR